MARISVRHCATLGLALVIAACSDDFSPTGTDSLDKSPPSVVSVTSNDAFHVNVVFDEPVTIWAGGPWYYTIVETGNPVAITALEPGDTIRATAAVLLPDNQTVALTTGQTLAGKSYRISVNGIEDLRGNRMTVPEVTTFLASASDDVTPPQLVRTSPEPGAAGVALDTRITMQFSEPITFESFANGVIWTGPDGTLDFGGGGGGHDARYMLFDSSPMEKGKTYRVRLTGLKDLSGNTMPDTEWAFTTRFSSDTTPPLLISTTPGDQEVDVDVNSVLTMTFSEPIDDNSTWGIEVSPGSGGFGVSYSDGGKTLTYEPLEPLRDNQQYRLTIFSGRVYDRAGNAIEKMYSVVFTTGSQLESGAIAGTVAGDPGTMAIDPTGATVFAVRNPSMGEIYSVAGNGIVENDNTYLMPNIPDGTFYLMSVLDTDHDGVLSVRSGDAIGAYGANAALSDFLPEPVTVDNGNRVTGANFSMTDPSVVSGSIEYAGDHAPGTGYMRAGIFSTTDFDPANPFNPLATSWPSKSGWSLNSAFFPFADGDYYVFAYLDVNGSGDYESAIDPAGTYGGDTTPTAIHVSNGNDYKGIVIRLHDPVASGPWVSVAWPEKHSTMFEKLCEALDKASITTE